MIDAVVYSLLRGGAKASSAVAQIAPTTGIVIRQEARASCVAGMRSSFSSTAISEIKSPYCNKPLKSIPALRAQTADPLTKEKFNATPMSN